MKRARILHDGVVHQAIEAGPDTLRLGDGRTVSVDGVVWLPPVQPRTIVALGLNYADHASELAFKAPDEPLIFLKGPNALVGHRGSSARPADVGQMHPECELAVVIGRTARRVRRAGAYDCIAGYSVANDYALRDYLENYYRPNLRVKNRDGCTPLGPWLVDGEDIDPMNLRLRTTVNGVLVQEGSTADMIFDVPFLIEYLTGFMTLQPGDLILTGTPRGVGFVQPGDVVVAEIEGIGRLENTIVAGSATSESQSRAA